MAHSKLFGIPCDRPPTRRARVQAWRELSAGAPFFTPFLPEPEAKDASRPAARPIPFRRARDMDEKTTA